MGAARILGAVGVAVAVALAAGACIGPVTRPPNGAQQDEHGVGHHGPEPTARSHDGDVEVWDLRVAPSYEAFGMRDRSVPVGAYSSSDTRQVRLLLPDGARIQVPAREVVFSAFDSEQATVDEDTGEEVVPEGRSFSVQVSGSVEDERSVAVDAYRDALRQLDLPAADGAAALLRRTREIHQPEGSQRLAVSDSRTFPGVLQVQVETVFRPPSDDTTYHLRVFGYWDAVPIPSASPTRSATPSS